MTFHDDELDDFLIEKLKLIEPTPPRDPESTSFRRDEYLQEVKYFQHVKPWFTLTGLLERKPWLNLFNQRPALIPFTAAILLILGLIFGSWGTVYAAQNSLPNDFLYSLKLTSENIQLAYTQDIEARIALLATYTDRRVAEATTLALKGEAIPEELPNLMDEHLDELFKLIISMDEASAQEALKGIQIHLRDQDQEMTNALSGLPEGQDPQLVQLQTMVKARQQVTQMGLEKSQKTLNQQKFKYQQGKPVEAITEIITTTETTTSTLTTTTEITVTLTITNGHYGPGPCLIPGACTPSGYTYGPGPFRGATPVPEDHEGYGPGSNQDPGQLEPPTAPKPDDNDKPKGTPNSDGSGNDSNNDSDSGDGSGRGDSGDSGDNNGTPKEGDEGKKNKP